MKIKIIFFILTLGIVSFLLLSSNKQFNFTQQPEVLTPGGTQKNIAANQELSCPVYSYRTDLISLEQTKIINGVKLEFYKNKAYACSKSGYHTFLIAYPENQGSININLWIRMHGGGAGAYRLDGIYSPTKFCSSSDAPCFINEESLTDLGKFLKEEGLVKEVISHGGFRFLVPSMCDHDFYSGIGDRYEQFNPNITAIGEKNKAEGLLALRAAIDYTAAKYPTSHVFAHGTSAGSLGAATLSVALACEGKGISGAILDSGLAGPYSERIVDSGCSEFSSEDLANINQKIGPFTQISPDQVVKKGLMKTPLFDFWTSKDWTCACKGEDKLTVESLDGQAITGSGCYLTHKELDEAILSSNSSSTFREVCVGTAKNPQGMCSSHIPTIFSQKKSQGDLSREREDYNKVIFDWVKERLNDPIPK